MFYSDAKHSDILHGSRPLKKKKKFLKKIPDQNNRGDLSKELNLGGAKLRGDLTF